MAAQYPNSIYTPRTMVNRVGVVYDSDKTKVIYAEDINKDRDEIVALQNELGLNAKGAYSSVKAWLVALASAISAIVVPVKATGAEIDAGTDDAKFVTAKAIEDSSYIKSTGNAATATTLATARLINGVSFNGSANIINNFPRGFLINGKIVPSVSSNNLTVAIKGLDGNDPSATNPVYCRVGDTIRTISGAKSFTRNAGTNWFNAGSAELATKEIDYFVYLLPASGVDADVFFTRVPYANIDSDLSNTTTSEKYGPNNADGSPVEYIGRFAATLSAGPNYTWSVPTFTPANLIQRPIYETRWLNWLPVMSYSGGGGSNLTPTNNAANYKIVGDEMKIECDQTMNASLSAGTANPRITFPFNDNITLVRLAIVIQDASDTYRYFPGFIGNGSKPAMDFYFDSQDAGGAPPAIAASDRLWIQGVSLRI